MQFQLIICRLRIKCYSYRDISMIISIILKGVKIRAFVEFIFQQFIHTWVGWGRVRGCQTRHKWVW